MGALVYIDGRIEKPENARVSVMDRGFLFGDGVYEAGRSYDRCFLYLEEHWQRFRSSAAKLCLPIPWSDEELTSGLHQVAAEFGADCCFRTIATRGSIAKVGLDLEVLGEPTLVHVVQDIPDSYRTQRESGVIIDTSKILRNRSDAQDPNIKTSNYLNSLLAQQDVQKRTGRVNAILCNAAGDVTEGTNFSIFAVRADGTVITPSLEVGILDSITRRHVLQVAEGLGKTETGFYPLADMQACPEVFIVSSTREVMPVSQWDGKNYPAPGMVTKKLGEGLTSKISQYVASHPKF